MLLDYNLLHPSYQGNVRIDPLLLSSGTNSPLAVHINVPVVIEKDAVHVSDATFNTSQSQIQLNASLQNMKAPQIQAQLKAGISLPEMQQSFALPIDPRAKLAPKNLNADLAVSIDGNTSAIQLQSGRIGMGRTTLEASGSLDSSRNTAVQFRSTLALNELAALLKVSGVSVAGDLNANGDARLDAQKNYSVNGTLNSRDLSIRSGTTRVPNLSLYSPFHADPFLISLDGLRLNAFGGSLAAKVFVEKLARLSIEGNLRNFSLPVLANAFTGKAAGLRRHHRRIHKSSG